MLRRVRKEDVRRDSWIEPDPLDKCLDCWKIYMSSDSDRDLKAKTMPLMGNTDGYGRDAGEEQQARDLQIGAATDAMINSLSRYHQWAISRLTGIITLWSYPNADILIVGPEARTALTEKLKKNVCTGVFF